MKLLPVLAALMLAAPLPALAQSSAPRLFGNAAGATYCKLRAAGVAHHPAVRYAISSNLSEFSREPFFDTPSGRVTSGAIDMANYIQIMCPQFYNSPSQAI